MKISRKELIQEIDEELLLREGIRKAISIVTKKRAGALGAAAKAERGGNAGLAARQVQQQRLKFWRNRNFVKLCAS